MKFSETHQLRTSYMVIRNYPEPAVSRILFPCKAGTAIIHLAPGSLLGSSGLPKSIGRAVLDPFRERFSI